MGVEFMEGALMYVQVRNKLVEVDRIENGVPVIKSRTEVIKKPDGTQDVVVHVPCLKINSAKDRS